MNVIHGEAVTRRDMETSTNSIHFHITIDLTALGKGVFNFLHGFVILTLLDVGGFRRCPFFQPVSFPYFLAGVTTSANKIQSCSCVQLIF